MHNNNIHTSNASPPRERKTDAVPPRRNKDKYQATHRPHRHRQRRQHLQRGLRWRRVEATDHVLIEHRHRREDQNREESMHEVDELDPVLRRLLRREAAGAIDDPEAAEGGDAVPYLTPPVPEAVGEAHREARGSAEGEDGGGGALADEGPAFPFMGDDRRKELERQNGAGRKEIREVRRSLESFPHNLLPWRFCRLRRRGR